MQFQIESRTSPTSRRQIIHSHRAFSSPLLENLKLTTSKKPQTRSNKRVVTSFLRLREREKKVLLLWKLNINCQSDSKEFHQVARRDFSCSWMNKGTGGLFSQSSTFPCDNKESKVHYKERIWAAAWWNMISGLVGYCAWGWTWRLAYSIQHRSHHRFFFWKESFLSVSYRVRVNPARLLHFIYLSILTSFDICTVTVAKKEKGTTWRAEERWKKTTSSSSRGEKVKKKK